MTGVWYAKQIFPRLVFCKKKNPYFYPVCYNINSLVKFKSEVKSNLWEEEAKKYILGFIALEFLLNIVFFETLTYNYWKTVLSEEHLKTLSSLGNHSGPGNVEKSSVIWKWLIFDSQCNEISCRFFFK